MMINRQDNIEAFKDTVEYFKKDEAIKKRLRYSTEHTIIGVPKDKSKKKSNGNNIEITKETTIEAARRLSSIGKVAILNFANATHPGGGVASGSFAQEESICRVTSLYPCLKSPQAQKLFYDYHKEIKNTSARVIYSQGVVILKDDKTLEWLPEEERVTIDVITCAANNIHENHLSGEETYELFLEQAKMIITGAAFHHADALVLGAFGCGAFGNDPYIVARAFKDALDDDLRQEFNKICFAIYSHGDNKNYEAFKEVLEYEAN